MICPRRTLLRFVAAAAVVSALPVRAAGSAGGFAPPASPMLYARRLERGLPGGAAFVVSRSFEIRFVPEADGFRVEGEQVGVEVEAPEQLAAFARIERERHEMGLFPLHLDAAGAIHGASPGLETGRLDEAVREVIAQIERGDHADAEREELRAFVAAVHRSADTLLTELPRDLFAPREGTRTERRAVVLPRGETGEVRMTFTAERDPASGLMRTAARELVTTLAGDLRRTVESWRLEPLA